jgi:formate C-acetyltransferase
MSIESGAIQYENDDIMRPLFSQDYGIACCVSAMGIGKQMQYFGARTNLAKALLLSINGGVDEISGKRMFDNVGLMSDDVLNYDQVFSAFDSIMQRTAKLYVDTMNVIHYMHDKYAYEKSLMALHDTVVARSNGLWGRWIVGGRRFFECHQICESQTDPQ